MTVDQWVEICERAEADWTVINPLRAPQYAKAVFTVLVSDHSGQDREVAGKAIGEMTTDQFLQLFTEGEEDLPEEFQDGIPQ